LEEFGSRLKEINREEGVVLQILCHDRSLPAFSAAAGKIARKKQISVRRPALPALKPRHFQPRHPGNAGLAIFLKVFSAAAGILPVSVPRQEFSAVSAFLLFFCCCDFLLLLMFVFVEGTNDVYFHAIV
jgi:hypothetical protein